MTNRNRNDRERPFVSRDEFGVFGKHVDKSFSDVTDAIHALTKKIDRIGSTDWKTLGMFASLILAIGSLAAAPFVSNLSRLERNQDLIREKVQTGTGDRWTESEQREFARDVMAEVRRLEGLISNGDRRIEDKFDMHTSNGHPQTVMDRVDRFENLLDEVRLAAPR